MSAPTGGGHGGAGPTEPGALPWSLDSGLMERMAQGVLGVDRSLRVRFLNPAAREQFGYAEGEAKGQPLDLLFPEEAAARLEVEVRAVLGDGSPPSGASGEVAARQCDGELFPADVSVLPAGQPGLALLLVTDRSERRALETIRRRFQLVMDTVRAGHRALVAATEEQELFEALCREAVEVGGYRFAWVGRPEDNPDRIVTPVAWSGHGAGYLETVRVTWGEDVHGQGPVGRALRHGQPVLERTTQDSPTFRPWQEAARERGYESVLALPMMADRDTPFAVLAIYAGVPDAFDEEETHLLHQLAEDLAHGIRTLRARQQWRRERERLVGVLEATPDFVGIADPDGRVLYRNAGGWRMLGREPGEAENPPHLRDALAPWARERILEEALPRAEQEGCWEGESAFLTASGEEVPVSQTILAHRDETGCLTHYSTVARDITAAKRIEAEMNKLSSALEQSGDMVWITDPHGRIEYVNPAFVRTTGYPREEAVGASIGALLTSGVHGPERYRDLWETVTAGAVYRNTFTNRRRNGELFHVEETITPVTDGQGRIHHLVATGRDVTERLAMESRLREAQRLAQVGTWERHPESGRFFWAEETYRILGIDPGTAPNARALLRRVPPADRPLVGNALRRPLEPGGVYELEFRLLHPTEGERVVFSRARVEGGAEGPTRVIGVVQDVTRLKEAEDRAQFLAHFDPLTRLPNRHLFNDRLEGALCRERAAHRELAVALVDLDRFTRINDSLGHEVGDRLLREVATRFRASVPQGSTVARFSGDQFALLLEDLAGADQLHPLARQILDTLSEPFCIDGHQLYVTANAGFSLFPRHAPTPGRLLRQADQALQSAKARGRDNYAVFSPSLEGPTARHLGLEAELRQALDRGELYLLYQPQYHLGRGCMMGVEALLRWSHPERGTVPPSEFIPLLEEMGLIDRVGEWALETACAQARTWVNAGLPPFKLSVNLSARQFLQGNLVDRVAAILSRTRLPADRLQLEITESLFMEEIPEVGVVLQALNDRGIRLALDDFGTGYSALSYLRRFPMDTLKIDRAFVREISLGDTAELVRAIVNLARPLGMGTIAEGVETRVQAAALHSMGCHEVQGFGFSPPVPPERIPELAHGPLPVPRK
ncbi:MAG: EAL domain-containing protein [Thiohalorhabdus sp.]|uniref:bifunctional diguanylate cyclase/phosphodiesterase n=1 Tax=Thiohalorhabdus sp. TaxID=3094134 RepID=UPI00397EA31A